MSKAQSNANPIERLMDWFIPPELAAERETRQLARMFLISHICGPFLGNVVPGTLLFVDPNPGWPVGILAASITGFWVFPFLLRAFGAKHYNLICFISVQNLAFCILWSCYFYGGVTSPTLPWVLTIPLLTFCYIGPSPRLRAFALALFGVNVAGFIGAYVFFPPGVDGTPAAALQGLGIVSTLACLAYVAMMALYYRRILDSGAELELEMREHLVTAARLRRATAEAERASAAKAEFVASMSHELRTPLNAVIGYSQLLLEEAEEENDQDSVEDLEKIHKAGKHLLHLVNDILDLSKIEAGKMELVSEQLVVAEFLQSIVEHQRPKADAKGLALTVELAPDLGAAVWDGARVRQTLAHIVENAIKFTEAGEVRLVARRQGRGAEAKIVVEVRDTGVGIDREVLPFVFEKFTVAEDASSSKYGGTGLGLALSLAFCRIMGGAIAVDSALGRGSCFTITQPDAPTKKLAADEDRASAAADHADLAELAAA